MMIFCKKKRFFASCLLFVMGLSCSSLFGLEPSDPPHLDDLMFSLPVDTLRRFPQIIAMLRFYCAAFAVKNITKRSNQAGTEELKKVAQDQLDYVLQNLVSPVADDHDNKKLIDQAISLAQALVNTPDVFNKTAFFEVEAKLCKLLQILAKRQEVQGNEYLEPIVKDLIVDVGRISKREIFHGMMDAHLDDRERVSFLKQLNRLVGEKLIKMNKMNAILLDVQIAALDCSDGLKKEIQQAWEEVKCTVKNILQVAVRRSLEKDYEEDSDQESVLQAQALLKEQEIDINFKDEDGDFPLLVAVSRESKSLVPALLRLPGINVNLKDNGGVSALSSAAWNGRKDYVATLLKVPGIDGNSQDNDGFTALMRAAQYGYVEIVKILLSDEGIKAGVNINQTHHQGWTALMLAVYNGRYETAKLLLSVDSSGVNLKNSEGLTALGIALQNKYASTALYIYDARIVELLRKHGATE